MNKNIKNITHAVSAGLCFILVLNSCLPPQASLTTKKSTHAEEAFHVQQVEEPDVGDPFYSLPVKPDPADAITILSADSSTPITTSISRKFPKNHATGLNNIRLEPAILQTQIIPGQVKKEVRKENKETIKQWKRWGREVRRKTMMDVHQAQHLYLQDRKTQFDYQQNLLTDSKSRKDNKKEFEKEQDSIRQEFLKQRKDLRTAFKQDIKNIPNNLNVTNTKNDFSVEFVEVIVVGFLFFVVGGILDGVFNQGRITKSIGDGINNAITYLQNIGKNIPSPTNVADNGVPNSQNPYPQASTFISLPDNTQSQRTEPQTEVVTVQFAQRIVDQAIQMYNNSNALAIFGQSFKPLVLPFRAQTIFTNLKDPDTGLPVIDFDPSELTSNKYSQCAVSAIKDVSQIDVEKCDFALVSQAQNIDWRVFKVDGKPVPEWLSSIAPKQGEYDSSLLMTLNFTNPQSTTNDNRMETWLLSLLLKYFPATYNRNDKANVANLKSYANKMKDIYFKIKTPPTCEQVSDLDIHSEKVVSVQYTPATQSVLFDGDYNFELGFTQKSSDTHAEISRPIANVSVKELSRILGEAAFQKYNRFSSPEGKPLTMTDTATLDLPWQKVQIKNTTGNLYNLKVEKLGRDTCKLYYQANCIDGGNLSFQFLTRRMETGLYRLSTQYSTAKFPEDDNDPFNNGPVRGVNANNFSAKALSSIPLDPYGYDFLVINGAYSTFARYSSLPESGELYSTLANSNLFGSGDNSAYVDTFKNGGLSYAAIDELVDSDIIYPTKLEPLTDDTFLGADDLPATRVLKEIKKATQVKGSNAVFQTSASDASWKTAQKNNLFADLTANYRDEMRQVTVNSAEQKFLNIGAIVTLHNKDFSLNQALINTSNSPYKYSQEPAKVPMLLQVVASNAKKNDPPIASWPFWANIGSQTVVERYWDGLSHPLDGDEEDSMPHYTNENNYRVRVVLDEDYLKSALAKSMQGYEPYFTDLRRDFKNAFISYPVLSQPGEATMFDGKQITSSQVSISVNNNTVSKVLTEDQKHWLQLVQNDIHNLNNSISNIDYTNESFFIDALQQHDFGVAQQAPPVSAVESEIKIIAENLEKLYRLPCAGESYAQCQTIAVETRSRAIQILRNTFISDEVFLIAYSAYLATLGIIAAGATITFTAGPTAAAMEGQRIYDLQKGLEAIGEVYKNISMKMTTEKKGCIGVSAERLRNVINIRLNIRARIQNALSNYDKLDQLYNSGQYNLANQIRDVFEVPGSTSSVDIIQVGDKSITIEPIERMVLGILSDLIQATGDCDECYDRSRPDKSAPTVQELECRICQATPGERALMRKALGIRKIFQDNRFGITNAKVKTVSFGTAIAATTEGNIDKGLYFGYSGDDVDYSKQQGKGSEALLKTLVSAVVGRSPETIHLAKAAKELLPNGAYEPIFVSRKNESSNNGVALQNDAEIKIMETANFMSNGVISAMDIFSDRITCPYCQQVGFRVNYRTPGHISSKIERIFLTGKPYYLGEHIISSDFENALNNVGDGLCR